MIQNIFLPKKNFPLCALLFLFIFGTQVFANPVKEMFEEATRAYAQGDYQKAIKYYEKTLEMYPHLAPAYNYLALAHKEIGTSSNDIIWLYERAIEIDPQYAAAYDNLGKTYYNLGEFDKAEEYCLKAIEIDPNLRSAQLGLAWIYLLGKSDPDEAIYYFEEVVEGNSIPYAYFGLGMAYFMDHQHHRVLEMITALRAIDQEDFAVHLETMVKMGRYNPGKDSGFPVIAPPKKQKSMLVSDEYMYETSASESKSSQPEAPAPDPAMRVRLRGKMSNVQGRAYQAPPEEDEELTGIERIRALQRKRLPRPGY